jgi:hypothetical protein
MAPITDEEWADLVAHELPKPSDPVIQQYLESRRALVAQEQKHRSGIPFFFHSTTLNAARLMLWMPEAMSSPARPAVTDHARQTTPSVKL